MGCKYKEKFEREWEGKPISAMRIKMEQEQADRNISAITKGKLLKHKRRYR